MSEALPRATQVLPAGGWVERTARHTVTLDFDDRFRRRKRYVAEDGFAFLLDLEEAMALREGDGLLLEGGGVILVRAAPEPLVEVRAPTPALLLPIMAAATAAPKIWANSHGAALITGVISPPWATNTPNTAIIKTTSPTAAISNSNC